MDKKSVPENILKIQKKLAGFEKGSRNYKKYSKILAKHIKKFNINRRVRSNIKTIESIEVVKKITENS